MLPLAARYMLTSLSEASRIMGLSLVEILILIDLATGPERVTAHGLAASLNIPRETCRRRINALRRAGWIRSDRLALPAASDCPDPRRLQECLAMFEGQSRRFAMQVAALRSGDMTLAGAPSDIPSAPLVAAPEEP